MCAAEVASFGEVELDTTLMLSADGHDLVPFPVQLLGEMRTLFSRLNDWFLIV